MLGQLGLPATRDLGSQVKLLGLGKAPEVSVLLLHGEGSGHWDRKGRPSGCTWMPGKVLCSSGPSVTAGLRGRVCAHTGSP